MRIYDRRGFTLIELLVVIAIIAILAAILFPVFAAAKEKGRSVTCLNNVKQLGIGISAYLDDWKKFPGGAPYGRYASYPTPQGRPEWVGYRKASKTGITWSGYIADCTLGSLWKYLKGKGTYLCPNDVQYRKSGANVSYSMNALLDWQFKVTMSDVVRPTKCVMFVDEGRGCYNVSGAWIEGMYDGWFYGHSELDPEGVDDPYPCHVNSNVFLFCDGHGQTVPKEKFEQLSYKPEAK